MLEKRSSLRQILLHGVICLQLTLLALETVGDAGQYSLYTTPLLSEKMFVDFFVYFVALETFETFDTLLCNLKTITVGCVFVSFDV
jgi:hypothetical protein